MNIKTLFTGGLLAAALVPWSAGAVTVQNKDMTFSADGNFLHYTGDSNGTYADASAGSFTSPVNDDVDEIKRLFGTGFELVLRDNIGDEDGVGTWNGLSFNLNVTDISSPGAWELSWSDPAGGFSLPEVLDFVFAIKAGDEWAAWYFEAVRIALAASPGSGTYIILWTVGNDKIPDLSHMTLYLRDSDTPDDIPLPGAVWLFGSALVGLVTLSRRRRLAA
jgi:hypothetical protein